MTAPPPPGTLDPAGAVNCPTCGLGLPEGLVFCPRCRAEAEGVPYDPDDVDRHERSYVLSLVLLSLGAFAVPRLLKSAAFGGGEKAVLAVLGIGQTILAFGIGYWFFVLWLPTLVERALAQ